MTPVTWSFWRKSPIHCTPSPTAPPPALLPSQRCGSKSGSSAVKWENSFDLREVTSAGSSAWERTQESPVLGGWCHLNIMAREVAELTPMPSPTRRATAQHRDKAMTAVWAGVPGWPHPWPLATLLIKLMAHSGQ